MTSDKIYIELTLIFLWHRVTCLRETLTCVMSFAEKASNEYEIMEEIILLDPSKMFLLYKCGIPRSHDLNTSSNRN